jgi:membrane protein implicated in regulation of membrane protease activity
MKTLKLLGILTLAISLFPTPAAAYIGPGAALSLLGAFWGLLVAVGAAIAFALAWPVKRLLQQRRERREEASTGPAHSA